jgi:peroxidase
MASFSNTFLCFLVLSIIAVGGNAQLSSTFYDKTCPGLQTIVRTAMATAVAKEARMGASILRLFFHDCFVNVIYSLLVIPQLLLIEL